MPAPEIKEFEGWVNLPQTELKVNVIRDCNNIRLVKNRILRVNGYEDAGHDFLDAVRGIGLLIKQDSVDFNIIITEVGAWSVVVGTSAVDITDVPWASTENPVNWIQFQNHFLFVNGVAPVKKWDGITATILDLGGLAAINVDSARTIEINNNTVLLGNLIKAAGNEPQEVIWCDTNNFEIWLPASTNLAGGLFFDEDPTEVRRIRRLGPLNVIYKGKSIWLLLRVGGTFVYGKRFFTDFVGIISTLAVEEYNNIHYFMGSDFDIYAFNGASLVSLGNARGIKDFIKENIDQSKLDQVFAYHQLDTNEVHFVFEKSDTVSPVAQSRVDIAYNYVEDTFTKRDTCATAAGQIKEPSSVAGADTFVGLQADQADDTPASQFGVKGVPQFKVAIGDDNDKIYFWDKGGSFAGVDIDAFVTFGDTDFSRVIRARGGDDFSRMIKNCASIKFLARKFNSATPMDVNIGVRNSKDMDIEWMKTPYTYDFDGSQKGVIPTRRLGVYIAFRFGTKGINKPFEFWGFVPRIEKWGEIPG